MADVYGPEFNLTTEEIINTIRRTYQIQSIGPGFNPIEVEVTLFNKDYYIRPGTNNDHFMSKIMEVHRETKEMRGEMDDNLLHFIFIVQLLGVIKECFDEVYFEEQIARRKQSEKIITSKDKLIKYMKKFNTEQLKTFLINLIICKNSYGMFISSISSTHFWESIHTACREKGTEVPLDFSTAEGQAFLKNNLNVYFDVLDTKVISNMLCDAIDLNIKVATSAAKKLYEFGSDAMIDYVKHEANARTSA
jgi:hypothetical protein